MKMYIDEGKYVEVNESSFIKNYLESISEKLEYNGFELSSYFDFLSSKQIYGLNSFRYDSEK